MASRVSQLPSGNARVRVFQDPPTGDLEVRLDLGTVAYTMDIASARALGDLLVASVDAALAKVRGGN